MAVLLVLTLAGSACTSTHVIAGASAACPDCGESSNPMVVKTLEGRYVRLDPNSRVRFSRRDGSVSEWLPAGDLWVNESGVFDGDPAGAYAPPGLFWRDIQAMEVENFNSGRTLLATLGVGAAFAALVAVASVARVAPGGAARLAAHTTIIAADLATRPRLAPEPAPGGASGSPAPSSEPPPEPSLEAPSISGSRPLFDGLAKRRAVATFGLSSEVAVDPFTPLRTAVAVTALVRLYSYVEFGAGIRGTRVETDGRDTVGTSITGPLYYGRFGFHAEIDAHRRFAFPLAFELGRGGGFDLFTRAVFGLRVRATQRWWVAFYPFNPVYSRTSDVASTLPRLSFPSSFELSVTY